MKTFFVQTLGCRVNHYESEQIASLLLARGLTPTDATSADLRVVNTCSVTTQAASQSRQSVRRIVRLPVIVQSAKSGCATGIEPPSTTGSLLAVPSERRRSRTLITGCWATSNPQEASEMTGVDAVVGHHHDLALELDRLLERWQVEDKDLDEGSNSETRAATTMRAKTLAVENKNVGPIAFAEPQGASSPGFEFNALRPSATDKDAATVRASERNGFSTLSIPRSRALQQLAPGATTLPPLERRQSGRQRAYLKIQDGCDAHCTYCIIPSLRPRLWSKPVDDTVREACALVSAGHVELVLTGIFLGAYGQHTALRRRQDRPTAEPLGELIDALCTRVTGLRRLRLSSLEPGDLTADLLSVLRQHRQVVPHFHLPLQSGSQTLLRRMNRQYSRDDFLEMITRVKLAFDRPALTTDIVVGFPGETDAEFERTVDLVKSAGFIHVHAFPYSPRPGTAASRWTDQYVRGPVVNERIEMLRALSAEESLRYRTTFIGQTVELIVERNSDDRAGAGTRHGRCERYFPVSFEDSGELPGESVEVEIVSVANETTHGRRTNGPLTGRSTLLQARVDF